MDSIDDLIKQIERLEKINQELIAELEKIKKLFT